MKRALFSVATYSAANVLNRLSIFLVAPILGFLASPAVLGSWAVMASLLTLCAYLMDFSFSKGVARFYFDMRKRHGTGTIRLIGHYRTRLLMVSLCITGITLLIVTGVTEEALSLLAVTGILLFATAEMVSLLAIAILRSEERPVEVLRIRATQAVMTLPLTVAGASILGSEGALGGIVIGAVVAALMSVRALSAMARAIAQTDDWADPATQTVTLRSIVAFSGPLTLQDVASWARNASAPIVLAGIVSADVVGSYFLGVTAASLLALLIWSADIAIAPSYYRSRSGGAPPEDMAGPYRIFSAGLSIVAVLGIAFSAPLVGLLLPDHQAVTARVTPILIYGASVMIFYTVWVKALFYAKKTVRLVAGTLTLGVLSVVATLIVTPRYGVEGAAWVSVIVSFGAAGYALLNALSLEARSTDVVYPAIQGLILTVVLVTSLAAENMTIGSQLILGVISTTLAVGLLAAGGYRAARDRRAAAFF